MTKIEDNSSSPTTTHSPPPPHTRTYNTDVKKDVKRLGEKKAKEKHDRAARARNAVDLF